ncbi:ArsR/SmtB family transcription factor [Mucilaginibacter sp. UYCu711]|uniref:ArsR/SmtB family transcription factor n=1 Tax=Mucilaginibacter sp. UYCu711 TaxID=3156339 RepID=UPI003D1ACF17
MINNMETDDQFATVAGLIAEPARANMLWNMLDGRAYTAGELALVANVSPQSASNHLNKLLEAGFIKADKQGKHRYYSFARPEVAYAIEAICNLMPHTKEASNKHFANGDIQYCRTCYDHLAGKIAVDLTQSLVNKKILIPGNNEFTVSTNGEHWFGQMGLNVTDIRRAKRNFAKPCLDWTERKHHLAGALGAAMLKQMHTLHWIRPKANSRIVILTGTGEIELSRLGIMLNN